MSMSTSTLILGLLLSLPLIGQESRPTAEDVLRKHRAALEKIDGVVGVSAGGTATDIRILIRVRDEEAKKKVRKIVGKTRGGHKVFIYVKAQVGSTAVSPRRTTAAKKKPGPTEPEPATFEDCDIMRDYLKMKPVSRHKNGKTYPSCSLMHRQRIGGGGGHSFWYTRHWVDCPIRTGRLKMPKNPDEFVKWVFTQGFQPATRRSFLGPVNLKGSDRLWFDQVKQDLTSLLPYIRQGARWVRIKDDKAGVGWKWEAPK